MNSTKALTYYRGDYHAERDLHWTADNKLVALTTWTIYRKVYPKQGAAYQTPEAYFENEAKALAALDKLGKDIETE